MMIEIGTRDAMEVMAALALACSVLESRADSFAVGTSFERRHRAAAALLDTLANLIAEREANEFQPY